MAAAVVLLFAIEPAAAKCMTKAEARMLHPKRHLYWGGARKCWHTSVSRARAAAREPVRRVPAALAALPVVSSPPIVPVVPDLPRAEPLPPLYDHPDWKWIEAARSAPRSGDVVFSTFAGEPPDVWPVLDAQGNDTLTIRSHAGGFVYVAVVALAAALFGLMLWGHGVIKSYANGDHHGR